MMTKPREIGSSKDQNNFLCNSLPDEVMEDILLRLPVKFLKQFRCVAKPWYCLIDSERFVKSHWKRSLATHSHGHLFIGGGKGVYMNNSDIYSVSLDAAIRLPRVVQHKNPPMYYVSEGKTSSCNGLFLVGGKPPGLWNPFTMEYKILPPPLIDADVPSRDGCFSLHKPILGLGYDSKTDDYKVVWVLEHKNRESNTWEYSTVQMYSLRLDCWSEVEGFPYHLHVSGRNWSAYASGALHMLIVASDGVVKIMAFSVETSKHYEVNTPYEIVQRVSRKDTRNRNWWKVDMDVLEGCLSLMLYDMSELVVYVMKDYMVIESWTKMFAIPVHRLARPNGIDWTPMVYSKDGGKVLMYDNVDRWISWYDVARKALECATVEDIRFIFHAEVCIESLVSPGRKMWEQEKILKLEREEKLSEWKSRKLTDWMDRMWRKKEEKRNE